MENLSGRTMAKAGLPEARSVFCPRAGAGRRGRLAGQLYSGKGRTAGDFVRLEPKNPERTAESATALLLANRLTQTALTPLALLHRPERITDTEMMASGIAQALDWMPVQPDAISGAMDCRTGREQRAALLSPEPAVCSGSP